MVRALPVRSNRIDPAGLARASLMLNASSALLAARQARNEPYSVRSGPRLPVDATVMPCDNEVDPGGCNRSANGLRAWALYGLYKSLTETPPPPRTRRAFQREITLSFQHVLAQGPEVLYQQIRMHADTFLYLCSEIEPAYERTTSMPGPKPLSPMIQIFDVLRLVAQGTSSWSCLVDWSVGRTTIMQTWVPKFCDAVCQRIQISKRPLSTDSHAWDKRAIGFHNLGRARYEKDIRTRGWRAESLAGVNWEALDPVAEVFDDVLCHWV